MPSKGRPDKGMGAREQAEVGTPFEIGYTAGRLGLGLGDVCKVAWLLGLIADGTADAMLFYFTRSNAR